MRSITQGEKVKLINGVARRMKTKEWIFRGIERGNIVWLMHESGSYGIGVRIELIDWENTRT